MEKIPEFFEDPSPSLYTPTKGSQFQKNSAHLQNV